MVLPDIYEQAGIKPKDAPSTITDTTKAAVNSWNTVDTQQKQQNATFNAQMNALGSVDPGPKVMNPELYRGIVTQGQGSAGNGYVPPTTTSNTVFNPELAMGIANKGNEDNSDPTQRDAFASMKVLFTEWGLGGLADTFTRLAKTGMSGSEALIKVKYSKDIDPVTGKPWNDAYNTRFKGNELRIAKGLNALSEKTYIDNENIYAETLTTYGLGNMLSTDRATNEAKWAEYIGNDVSSTEFVDRVKTASTSIINADPQVMKTFNQFYGHAVTKNDLIAYFLAPTEQLPILKQKVAAAEIGTQAIEQGLGTTEARAMQLARMGVNQPGGISAQTGYQNVAEVLPTGQKLSNIYKEAGVDYNQTTAEDEYLLSNAAAAKKRKGLASLERAQFSGDAGTNAASLGNQSLTRNVQGRF